jgi:hypothetical protein
LIDLVKFGSDPVRSRLKFFLKINYNDVVVDKNNRPRLT